MGAFSLIVVINLLNRFRMAAKKTATAAVARTYEYYTHKAPVVASLLSVKEIHCSFCPFNRNSIATRYMMQWLQTDAAQITNPDVKIFTTVLHDNSSPSIQVQYSDGFKLNLCGENLRFQELQNFFQDYTDPRNAAVK